MPAEAEAVQLVQSRLALIELAEVALQEGEGGGVSPGAREEDGGARTFSSAIRAWISYTCTVKSFVMRWTCRERVRVSAATRNGEA